MLRRLFVCLISGTGLLLDSSGVQADSRQPVVLSPAVLACDGCHGSSGHSAGPSIPSLAGQEPGYFVITMQAYRAGKRPATVMTGLAQGYTNADFQQMASYYSRQKPVLPASRPEQSESGAARIKAGARIFYRHCNTCHLDGPLWSQFHANRAYEAECSGQCHLDYGPDKGGITPRIGSQWQAYLEAELLDFHQGTRPMSPRKAKAFKGLTVDDLKAVAAFYASQQGSRP